MSIMKGDYVMPGRDGTGPMGRGVMTGRGLGFCNAVNAINAVNLGFGFGRGRGFGLGLGRGQKFGLGCGRGFRGNSSFYNVGLKTQKELLTDQKGLLQSRLDVISKQLDSLADAD